MSRLRLVVSGLLVLAIFLTGGWAVVRAFPLQAAAVVGQPPVPPAPPAVMVTPPPPPLPPPAAAKGSTPVPPALPQQPQAAPRPGIPTPAPKVDEATLEAAIKAAPREPAGYLQLAAFYNRQGDFPKMMGTLTRWADVDPGNPVAQYTIAAYNWDKAYRDGTLSDAQKRDYIARGLQAADRAIALNPEYMEALTYKNLLLRSQALLESDPAAQKALITEADVLRGRAIEIRNARQASGVPTDTYPPARSSSNTMTGAPPPPPPPPPPPAKKVSAAAPVPPDAPPPPPPPPVRMAGAGYIGGVFVPAAPVYERGEPGLTFPVVISETRPSHTPETMRAKIEGTVVLSCVVETDGTIGDVVVKTPLDPVLDEQAVLAAKQWRFTPGMKDGKPVRVRTTLEMRFTLRSAAGSGSRTLQLAAGGGSPTSQLVAGSGPA